MLGIALGGALLWGPSVRGQAIVWGAALPISGDSDVATTGTLVHAFNFGRTSVAATTVNGVNFEAFPIFENPPSASVGNFTLSESVTALAGSNQVGANDGSFANLSAAYQTLLGSVAYATVENFQTVTLTLGDLVAGHRYLFQWWSSDSSFSGHYSTTAVATNDVTLLSNVSDAFGETGQYVTGEFTATGDSLAIDFVGHFGSAPRINAFQLRDVSAVPEPSTYAALAGLGVMGFALLRRRGARR